jgi:hypothetical protein
MSPRKPVQYQKRSGWKRWLLRVFVVAIALPAIFIAGGRYYNRWQGSERLAEVHARLDETDPGWRLDDLLAAREAKMPPDEENIVAFARKIHPKQPPAYQDWNRRSPHGLPTENLNRLLQPDDAADLFRTREACRDVIEPARRIRHMTRGGFRLVVPANPLDTLLPHTDSLRGVAGMLHLDAAAAAHFGNPDRAISSALAGLNVGLGIGDEPHLISMLVRMACDGIALNAIERTLAWGEPREGLAEVQAALAREADYPYLATALPGERAFMDRLFENLDTGKLTLDQLSGQRPKNDLDALISGPAFWYYRGHLPADRARMLELFNVLIVATQTPTHEWETAFGAFTMPPPDSPLILTRLLFPAYNKVADAELRLKARLRAAAVGIACERYRRANGRWPNTLAEIPNTILPAVPTDPFDGLPLRFSRVEEDGLVIYSVGPDRTDDGGNLTTKVANPGEDHGFRLWDPAHRRAAPLPRIESPDER